MRKKFTYRDGFTLIEVILVILVTAIAIPVLIYLLGQQARFTVDSEKVINAAGLGQALMEEIRSKGYVQADTYDGYSDTKVLSGVQYSRGVVVCYVDSSALDTCVGGPTGFKRVEVTVSSDRGATQIVTLMAEL